MLYIAAGGAINKKYVRGNNRTGQIATEGEDSTLSLYEVPTNDQTREGAYIEMIELQTLKRTSNLYELSQEGLGDI